MFGSEMLSEQIIAQRGRWQRIRRWWRGVHPDKGTIVQGWTGLETLEEADRFIPLKTFTVRKEA
jgi:hypothetical protein